MRIIALTLLLVGLSGIEFPPQAAQAPPVTPGLTFEVASIKLNTGTSRIGGQAFQAGGRYSSTTTVALLLLMAYPTQSREQVGVPAWVTEDRYDIVATAGREATRAEVIEMIKSMLIERFKLQAHVEMREEPVYNLVVAREDGRLGPDIERSTLDCEKVTEQRRNGEMPRAPNGSPACGSSNQANLAPGAPGAPQIRALSTTASGVSMAGLAGSLRLGAGRVVIDRTGLMGLFDYKLRYSADVQLTSADAPSVFTAVQEQLGFRLQPATAPITVLVVDHIERPTEN